jgi:hypothetical protein
MKLDEDEFLEGICPYTQPDRLTGKYDGSQADFGIRIPRSYASPWLMYFYFFSCDGQEPSVVAHIHLKHPGSAFEKLAASCKELECGEHKAWISEDIPSDGSRDLVTVCNRVMDRWITMWKKAGGLRQFLPEKT